MSYEQLFLNALLLTLVVEVFVIFLFGKFVFNKLKNSDILFSGILASAFTLPYFWFVLPTFIPDRTLYIFMGESIIILLEAVIYFRILKLKFSQAFIVSFVANIISILVGLMVIK